VSKLPLDRHYTVRYNNPMDNRAALLDCALDLFAARGYDAVGVQEIVEAAGVTKPTLYHYFGSKQGLLQTLLEERLRGLVEEIRQAAEYRGDLPLNLSRLVQTHFRFATLDPASARLLLSLWYAPPESEAYQLSLDLNSRRQELLEELFRKAAEDHGNMRGRHKVYALSFMGMINAYIGLSLTNHLQLTDSLAYQAVHQFEHGIYS